MSRKSSDNISAKEPKVLRVVLSEARQAVDAFLQAAVEDPMQMTKGFCRFDHAFERLGDDNIVSAFIESLDDRDAHRRLVAAAMLRGMADLGSVSVSDSKAVSRATQLLIEAVRPGDTALQAHACYLMVIGGAPPEAEPWLKRLMGHQDELLRVMAAVARITIAPANARVVGMLRRGLTEGDPPVVLISAIGLLYGDPSSVEARAAMIPILLNGTADRRYGVLTAIKQQGSAASGFVDILRRLIIDPTACADVRGYAGTVLGWITRGTDDATEALATMLESEDHTLIQGAIIGFAEVGYMPDRVLGRLTDLISIQNEDVRVAAVGGLRLMGPRALPALPILLSRVGIDTDSRSADAIADALAAMGPAAAPDIIALIRKYDFRTLPTLGLAMSRMGVNGALAIADAIGSEVDVRVTSLLVVIIRDMPQSAVGAVVPALISLLDRTNDGTVASAVVMALGTAGDAATPAVPALIRCMTAADDELASRIERVLRGIGSSTLPALEEALVSTNENSRHRLAGLTAALWSGDHGVFEVYESLGDDSVWARLECVTDLLAESPMSFKTMETESARRRQEGKIPEGFAISERSLLDAVRTVEVHLSRRMVTRTKGRPSSLDTDAHQVVVEVKEYLRRKRLLRRHQTD